ncbi:glycoside hydrolase family 99-like domain-containing protein [Undibacterium sp. Xuan67W]|uniref:glycoside hydrolase family 99-like domain-containing protein n=1 Tax=Undibacterium sp. Xuan67W TaxID=3413057 RepID=UPI003BF0F89A
MENHTKYSRDVIPGIEESLSKIVEKIDTNSVVLDIGCSSGMLGRYLVMKKECVVDGVDLDHDAIDICYPVYRKVAIKNLETDNLLDSFTPESYDYIVVADVIEHLNQPEQLLRQLRVLIKPHGTILFSVPNITHIAASLELLGGKFSYAQNGLLDNTHLRFYSYKNLQAKLAESGIYLWDLDTVQRNLSDTEFGDEQTKLFPSSWLDAVISSRPDSLVYQWIFATKIYPSLEPVNDIARYQKKLVSPIFTTALYFSAASSGGFSEEKKLPGYKHEVNANEFIVEFNFQHESHEQLNQIRIDPASARKSIWIKQAHIVNLDKEILWRWSSKDADAELINAYWTGVNPDQGRILCSENDDPQWYPQIPLTILHAIETGYQFSMTICDDGALIDAQIETAWNRQKNLTQKIITEQTEAVLKQNTYIQTLEEDLNARIKFAEELTKQVADKDASLQRILNSHSWIITKPFRYINRKLKTGILGALQTTIFDTIRFFWRIFPLPRKWKGILKSSLISSFPSLFGRYRHWVNSDSAHAGLANYASLLGDAELTDEPTGIATYVPLLEAEPLQNKQVKLICFYLPQFHAIPQNNEWWGDGFTEWTNVKPAQPQFKNHYQPHIPGELGYYDLLDTSVQRRQIELAKLYGIEGFCFYFYWFGGTRLLEKPIENYLHDRSLDLPFCLCWANENWSRRWDGLDQEMLIQQKHSPEDDIAFIAHVAQYMRDERYIRVNGKPLLIVYRPGLLPSPKETVARWRTWCRENGIGEIYLAYTQSFESLDPSEYDFDAAIEFPPNNAGLPNVTNLVQPLSQNFQAQVYDWSSFIERSEKYKPPGYQLFRSVCPSWDNTARRKNKGSILINSEPVLFQKWLSNAIKYTCDTQTKRDERLVFVNAWNEWAEGAHLEPDQRYGYAFLEAARMAQVTNILRSERVRINRTIPIAIVVHAYYEEIFDEILSYANKLTSVAYKLYITAPNEIVDSVREKLFINGQPFLLESVENRGRDVLPFLNILPHVINNGHEILIKVHTKKSLHREDGYLWRKELYDELISENAVNEMLNYFDTNPDAGLYGPKNHVVPMSYYWGANASKVNRLAKRLGIQPKIVEKQNFIAGTMFAARVNALQPLLNLSISDDDFEAESGQIDGTLAHAIERIISISSVAAGYSVPKANVSNYKFVG